MKITGPQVISELREKLQFEMGRHLYGLLGTYTLLAEFEQSDLAQARDPHGNLFPLSLNLNRELLARIGDDDLRQLVRDEARRPQAVQRRLGQELDNLLGDLLQRDHLLILKQLELVFAYNLDLSVFRTRATNQNHIVLLLPGERRGDHITLFHEAEPRFHRSLPGTLIADNHLWELKDA
jgi:hypothetical protein